MKKTFWKSLLMLICCFALLLSLAACDTNGDGDKDKDDDQSKNENNVDASFESSANAALQTDQIKLTSTSRVEAFMSGESLMTVLTESEQILNGKNAYVVLTQSMNYAGSPASAPTKTYTTQIKEGDGYKFYVEAQGQKILISATANEVENAEDAMVAKMEALQWSVKDFNKAVSKNNSDGSITYTCSGLKDGKEDAYFETVDAIVQNLVSAGLEFEMDNDDVTFICVIKDGKYQSVELGMEFEVSITVSGTTQKATYKLTSSNEYIYETEEVKAPTGWNYDADTDYTWDQYWALLQ